VLFIFLGSEKHGKVLYRLPSPASVDGGRLLEDDLGNASESYSDAHGFSGERSGEFSEEFRDFIFTTSV